MQFGRVIITTKDLEDKDKTEENERVAKYIEKELKKIHKDLDSKTDVKRVNINKTLSYLGIPHSAIFFSSADNQITRRKADMDILKLWTTELPMAPQTIEYIVKSTWSRGWTLELNQGEKENKALREKITNFFKKSNRNNKTLQNTLQAFQRNRLRYGNGYIEKVLTRNGKELAELIVVSPFNMVVLINEDLNKQGILEILGYAKVENITHASIDNISKQSKLEPWQVIHQQYIDDGEAYGKSGFEFNQQITMLILNILNLNTKKFQNEIRHSLHIDMGQGSTIDEANIFLHQYKTQYLGTNNFGKPLITYGGMTVEQWELPDKDFDYETFMNSTGRTHAPTLLNVSPSEILNAEAKYSNASQGHISTVLNTIYEEQRMIEDIVNNRIIPEIEGIAYSSRDKVIPEGTPTYKFTLDKENLFSLYNQAASISALVIRGVMSINDARRVLDTKNLPPIEDEWANAHFVLAGKNLLIISEELFFGADPIGETGVVINDQDIDEPNGSIDQINGKDVGEENVDGSDNDQAKNKKIQEVIDSIIKGKKIKLKK